MPFINRCGDAPKLQTKTVTPTHTTQTVTPDTGFDAMEKVIINAPTFQTKTVTTDGTFTPDAGYAGMSSVIVNTPRSAYFTASQSDHLPSGEGHRTMTFDIGDYWDLHGVSPSSILLAWVACSPNFPGIGPNSDEPMHFQYHSIAGAYLIRYDNEHYIGYLYKSMPDNSNDVNFESKAGYNPKITIKADDTNKVLLNYDSTSKKVTIDLTLDGEGDFQAYFSPGTYNYYTSYGYTRKEAASFYQAMFLWE